MTRSDVGKGHPDYYQDMAERIGARAGRLLRQPVRQPRQPQRARDAPRARRSRTQLDCRLDAVVCGVGSGGTLTGLSRYFARGAPDCEMVLADPQGSVLAELRAHGADWARRARGWSRAIGEDFMPPHLRPVARAHEPTPSPTAESFRRRARCSSRRASSRGSSTGTLLAAALRYCREQTTPKRVVHVRLRQRQQVPVEDVQRLLDARIRASCRASAIGDLRDVITRALCGPAVVTLSPTDTLLVAYSRMKLYDVSQMPVLEGGKVVGIVDESDLLLRGDRRRDAAAAAGARRHVQASAHGGRGHAGARAACRSWTRATCPS